MAHARDGARSYGKSDPIDALAVARAALREPDLATAHVDHETREIRLLVDHREDLVAERTRHINRVQWHFHEIDPGWEPKERGLSAFKNLDLAEQRLVGNDVVVARVAVDLLRRIRELTAKINALSAELDERTKSRAPHLRKIHGVAALAAAKLIAEVAGISRFKCQSKAYPRIGSLSAPL